MIIGVDYKNIVNNSKGANLEFGAQMIAAELELLLGLKQYSLFFGNNMGLDLEKYLGLTNRTATFNLIKADIEELFSKYRRAKLKKLEMDFDGANSRVIINVTVTMAGSSFNEITIPLRVQN
jgi:hypothetical protein